MGFVSPVKMVSFSQMEKDVFMNVIRIVKIKFVESLMVNVLTGV